MDRQTASIVLVLMTALAVFAAVQPIIPSYNEPFSEIGVLGPSKTIGGYPATVVAGSQVHLYGYIGNHQGFAGYYQFLVKLGNQTTQVSNSTYAKAPVILSYSRILDDNQSTTFPLAFTLSQPGNNVKVIFELWSYNGTSSRYEYTGLWSQLLLNVTNPRG